MIRRSHMASFAAYVAATYSDSAVDSVISSCFFEDQEIAPPLTRKTYPEMACRCSCEDPSASVYPSRPFPLVPYTNFQFLVPNRYRKTRLTASQWTRPGFSMNWANSDTEKGRVATT